MTKLSTLALSAALAFTLASAAHAQSASPEIPNPANPYPANPVSTSGTPLPVGHNIDPVQSGRSVFTPVGAVLDDSARAAGSIINVVPATADALTRR